MSQLLQVKNIIRGEKGILNSPILEETYLSKISSLHESHSFLGKSTQAVYVRQTQFIATFLKALPNQDLASYKVLDWGCGKGQITYLLKKEGLNITSCDLQVESEDSSFGQEIPIIKEQKIDVIPLTDNVHLPFPSESFDCVLSFGVLEHVKQDLSSMQEVRRILKKDGLFIITFLPYKLSWTQALAHLRGNFYHDRLYWRSDIKQMAENSGFEIASIEMAQLFPKNSIPLKLDRILEKLDRLLCAYTPLKFFATNLEVILIAK
ncbi:class I SAM-dependent methyltransferase [Polynucleobacter sp. 71A-WALBACH]|uniref:class I SAM-dependent methyltransferase n=1 Tax=Polynucleobacter sp. 71A-WALBACH TaxID=2689097 RepID=UPI001C0D0FA4|nr:class I SAM-dependent methyltransferase [Polynucleobacter sp. 71A-WALBACH]MBU3593266.1 class I SAM-dependent methyltransferase [Polynucleobacter sp. 71A-WALBACH]